MRTFSYALLLALSASCTEWEAGPGGGGEGGAGNGAGGRGGGAAGEGSEPTDYPKGLHVEGNRILDAEGNDIVLVGVNHSGSEYKCIQSNGFFEGDADEEAVRAMKTWNVNAVRIPLNESCWLGINGVLSSYSGEAYKAAIKNFVALLHRYGIVPILDLHWAAPGTTPATRLQPMPNMDHSVDFWRDVALTFQDDSGVVFELYNEPFPDSNRDSDAGWQCWRDGCTANEWVAPGTERRTYEAAGMQSLVDAIRETGSEHVIVVGGLQYSNALSQWLAYKPEDPTGNLAAAWHVYNFNACRDRTCWEGAPRAVAAEVPLVATEIGQDDCQGNFISALMEFLDEQGSGYLAWAWTAHGACDPADRSQNVEGRPWSLITHYDNPAPTGEYAETFRDHLLSRAE